MRLFSFSTDEVYFATDQGPHFGAWLQVTLYFLPSSRWASRTYGEFLERCVQRKPSGFRFYFPSMSERLSIVCEQTGKLLGYSLPRHEAIAQGAWCQTTNVFVVNGKGEVLCHQRSLTKERLPGGWSTHLGGHVSENEGFDDNARKELEEEAGLVLPAESIIPWRTSRLERARIWMRDYVAFYDGSAEELTPQPGEVERFVWMSPEAIAKRIQAEPHMWFAGAHDFIKEYDCLRAVLAAGQARGIVDVPLELHVWHPLQAA